MLVGQRVPDVLNLRDNGQDLVAHLVHGVLHASTGILCKGIQSNLPGLAPSLSKLWRKPFDLVESRECLPIITTLDLGAQDSVPRLGQLSVLVAVEPVEGGSSALEHKQLVDARRQADSATIVACDAVNLAQLLAISVE